MRGRETETWRRLARLEERLATPDTFERALAGQIGGEDGLRAGPAFVKYQYLNLFEGPSGGIRTI